jgi:hypothetical protein
MSQVFSNKNMTGPDSEHLHIDTGTGCRLMMVLDGFSRYGTGTIQCYLVQEICMDGNYLFLSFLNLPSDKDDIERLLLERGENLS